MFNLHRWLWSLDGLIGAVILNGNLLSLWQMQIIFLSPHSAIIMSSCMPTHIMVVMIPPNGLNLTFPIIAIWLLSPTPTHCSITRSFGGHQPLLISAAHHSVGPCLIYKNSICKYTINLELLLFFSLIALMRSHNPYPWKLTFYQLFLSNGTWPITIPASSAPTQFPPYISLKAPLCICHPLQLWDEVLVQGLYYPELHYYSNVYQMFWTREHHV